MFKLQPMRDIMGQVRFARECYDSQRDAQRYNPATVARFRLRRKELRIVLPSGNSDNVRIYLIGDRIYVLSTNTGLGYAGVTEYDLQTLTESPYYVKKTVFDVSEVSEIFCQNSEELDSLLEYANALDRLSYRTLARRLIDMLP